MHLGRVQLEEPEAGGGDGGGGLDRRLGSGCDDVTEETEGGCQQEESDGHDPDLGPAVAALGAVERHQCSGFLTR